MLIHLVCMRCCIIGYFIHCVFALWNTKKMCSIPEICAKHTRHMRKKDTRGREKRKKVFVSFSPPLVHRPLRSIRPFSQFMVIAFILFGCNSYFYALFVSFKARRRRKLFFFQTHPQTQCNNKFTLLLLFCSCFLCDIINALNNIRRNTQTLNSVCMCVCV